MKRAVILAGGKGTRLKPYTLALPKPLVPINQKPILEIIINQLINNGFGYITIAVNHMADIIKAFFGDGSKWGIKIDYSIEKKPLSTMGPLRIIKDLPENFLIMNGDVLTDLDYSKFYNWHIKNKNLFTISSFLREHIDDYGILEIDKSKKLINFKEKPKSTYNVSMGIYMANKDILSYIPQNKFFGFDHLMDKLIKENQSIKVKTHSGYWLDIGRPEDYSRACDDLSKIIK